MYIGVILAVYFGVRAYMDRGKPVQSKRTKPIRRLYLAISWWVLASCFAILAAKAASEGLWSGWLVLLAIVVVTFPWWIARHILAPLGLVRSAGHLTQLSFVMWSQDRSGGTATAGALALLHTTRPRPRAQAVVERWLDRASPSRGGHVLAHALLAVRRNDLATARRLVDSISELDPRAALWLCRALANEWLVLDAAECGEWTRVAELTRRKQPNTRVTRFLRAVAARLLRAPEASVFEVVATWIIAPRRMRTFSLMRRAVSLPPSEPVDRATEDMPTEPLDRALILHLGALKADQAVSAAGLREMGTAWDEAFADPSTAGDLLRRAAELQLTQPGDLTGKLRRSAADDLALLVRAAGVDWTEVGATGDVLGRAGRDAREELLSQIELALDRLTQRVEDKRALPVIDEWQEFTQIRLAYRKLGETGGPDLQRLVFDRVHTSVCGFAVWLYNKRGEKPLGNAMMRWLLAEARIIGDAEAIRLQTKNVGLGCGV